MLKHLVLTPKKIAAAPRNMLIGLCYHVSGVWEEALAGPGLRNSPRMPRDEKFRERSFTYAVIALSARVARSGELGLTKEKYVAFRDAFPLQDSMCGKIRLLFSMACDDAMPIAYYTNQIARAFPRRRDLFVSIISRLFTIAAADGEISRDDERMLARISQLLGLSAGQYTRIRSRHFAEPDAHETLGIAENAAPAAVKKRYRELMQHYHPDRFGSEKVSQEMAMLLQLRSSEINAAYSQLSKRAA